MAERDLTWRKPSRSGTNGDTCVEVATRPETVLVRDSKDTAGPVLAFKSDDWRTFLAGLRR